MTKEQIIEAIKTGNYRVEFESDCGCSIDWTIDSRNNELKSDVSSDACWIGTVLYIGGEAIAENIAYESFESLVDGLDAKEIVEIFDECEKNIWMEMSFDEAQENPDHQRKLRESLVDFINENEYRCYVRYPRNFGNEYDCILATKTATDSDIPNDAEKITAEEFAEKYTKQGDNLTEYYIGFDFVE